jgi:hypothetical protein
VKLEKTFDGPDDGGLTPEPVGGEAAQQAAEEEAERVEQVGVGPLEVVITDQVPLGHNGGAHHIIVIIPEELNIFFLID